MKELKKTGGKKGRWNQEKKERTAQVNKEKKND